MATAVIGLWPSEIPGEALLEASDILQSSSEVPSRPVGFARLVI